MDIKRYAEWQEVLKDAQDLLSDLRQPSRREVYRLYRWQNSSYILEKIDTEETILLRMDLKSALNAAREKCIDLRDIVLDI